MRVFLTGGTGFIGQALTKVLLREGWEVTVSVRRPESAAAQTLVGLGAQCVAGDILARDSMANGMAGADAVIHNAGHYELGVTRSAARRMERTNIDGTRNVLSLAKALSVPRVVHVSSVVAYGCTGGPCRDESFQRESPYNSVYERTKTEAHAIAKHYQAEGMPLIITCPGAVIGPNDHSPWGYFLRLYLNGLMPGIAWAPDAIQALVDVKDVARGIALATQKGRAGESYILAGEAIGMRDHFEFWKRAPGGIAPRIWISRTWAARCFMALEFLQRRLGLPAFISRETVYAGSMYLHYSSRKAQRELGWAHRSAEHMWRDTVDAELRLLQQRSGAGLVSRLNPV